MAEQLLNAHKQSKTAGGPQQKEADRQHILTNYVSRDAPIMPPELFKLILYYMYLALFVYMCRLPFSIVQSRWFWRVMWALRPNFAKQLMPRTLMRHLSTDLTWRRSLSVSTIFHICVIHQISHMPITLLHIAR